MAVACLWPATSEASKTQRAIIQDEARLLYGGEKMRRDTLDEVRALGAEIVKVTLRWRDLAPDPGASRKPAGIDTTNPLSYPLAAWAPYDDLVREARARGLEVFFLLGARGPNWASAKPSSGSAAVYDPNPFEFAAFVKAVGGRYSGGFSDPRETQAPPPPPPPPPPSGGGGGGGDGGQPPPPECNPPECIPIPVLPILNSAGSNASEAAPVARASAPGDPLPKVSIWSFWNEPNLSGWLQPQYKNRRVPMSPHVYRGLHLGGFKALSDTGHGGDEILIGNLLPFARSAKTFPGKVRPIEWLRELACLDSNYRRYRGRAASARRCTGFQSIPGTGVAYHPYTLAGGLLVNSAPHPDEASIDTLSKLTKALDRIGRARGFQRRRLPVWLSEFGWQTRPPDPFATSLRLVPEFIGQSEWLAFRNPRVKAIAQYPLVDDAVGRSGLRRYSGFQSGLRYSNGRAKPRVYEAYRYPFFVRQLRSNRVEIFGGVRFAIGGIATIESKLGGGGFRKVATAGMNSRGYFRKVLTISDADKRQFRFTAGQLESRATGATQRPAHADGEPGQREIQREAEHLARRQSRR